MKKSILCLFVLTFYNLVFAQRAPVPSAEQIDMMKKVHFIEGKWKGEAWIEFRPGQRHTIIQTEDVQSNLDGLILLIEGLGKSKVPGSSELVTAHHAFAILSYDDETKKYRFQTHLANGSAGDHDLILLDDKTIQWSLGNPKRGSMRYTITINEKGQWYEIGEMSRDGQKWRQFFEMTLDRVN